MSNEAVENFLVGAVEGFYGRPWTPSQRDELFQHFGEWKLNVYMYAPKDDKKHRAAWRQLYSESEAEEIARLIREAHKHNVHFIYALSPGLDLRFDDDADTQLVVRKLEQIALLGCQHFALLWDDIELGDPLSDAALAQFGSPARAQSAITNRVRDALAKASVAPQRFYFCPTEYCAERCAPSVHDSAYLREVGEHLSTDIDVFWTGPCILSEHISEASIDEVTAVLRRKPFVWDNLHANDYDQRRVYLGPYCGRPAALRHKLAGILSNANCEYPCNFVPLRTLARWSTDGEAYEARTAYEDACAEWTAAFATSVPSSTPVSVDDVTLLGDLFYLPYETGPQAVQLRDAFVQLCGHSDRPEQEWGAQREAVVTTIGRIVDMFTRLTEMDNRDLLYALYSYVWDVKEIALVMRHYLTWLSNDTDDGRRRRREPHERFSHAEVRPLIWNGGFLADMHRLLPMDQRTGTLQCVASCARVSPYVVRPYNGARKGELAGVYSTCLQTGMEGQDGTRAFPHHPTLIGERWVGPYVHLEAHLAFVLEHEGAVVGYVLGALDSRDFYTRMHDHYLPALCEKYPRDNTTQLLTSAEHEVVESLHSFRVDEWERFFAEYPSHLHIDLKPSAQGMGLGVTMIETLLGQLRALGSTGVHLQMAPANARALRFYRRLGFHQIHIDSDDLLLGLKL